MCDPIVAPIVVSTIIGAGAAAAFAPEMPKAPKAPPAAPAPEPVPTMITDETNEETADAKRKKLDSLRMGLASTIKTSASGATGTPSLATPRATNAAGVMGGAMGGGTKTKLGQ